RLHNRQQRLQCLPQFIADLLSCHANNNAQPPAFDDLVLLAALNGKLPRSQKCARAPPAFVEIRKIGFIFSFVR
ncbi:hypothetical protein ACI2TE_26030, partial [Ralstonia nicotianae]|nr:hypothetical protein [Ralstonia solanacearum]